VAVSDVHRIDARRPGIEQCLRESPGGGAEVERHPAAGADVEDIEGVPELGRPSQRFRRTQPDRVGGVHQRRGIGAREPVDEHVAGGDERIWTLQVRIRCANSAASARSRGLGRPMRNLL
jgi:hypothetical protein